VAVFSGKKFLNMFIYFDTDYTFNSPPAVEDSGLPLSSLTRKEGEYSRISDDCANIINTTLAQYYCYPLYWPQAKRGVARRHGGTG
jgi:hypothetical protein